MGFTLIAPTYMGIVLWVREGLIAQHQLPYLNLGPSVPALIYKKMETAVFTKTMSYSSFCKTMNLDGLTFIPYKVREGKRAGQPGYFAKFTFGDMEMTLSVSSKLVPLIANETASKDIMQISNVKWPDGTTGTIVHPAGEDAKFVGA
jgi:hypothetical protein